MRTTSSRAVVRRAGAEGSIVKRTHNFGAGPAVLPVPVLEEASRGVLEIGGSGMSILEVSHRGKLYEAIHAEAKERTLRVLGIASSEYAALFLGGGASLQFAMVPMAFLGPGASADYVDTGEWAKKAIKEARRFGEVNVAASSADESYARIPRELRLSSTARYVHITTNNTIEGTEWSDLPATGDVPLVADMSSDILARKLDYSRFGLIYAGAQKNAGPAGVTVVLARRDLLARATDDLPTMLSYRTHEKSDSLYNTPPVFGIYVLGLVMKWVEEQGGLGAMERLNCAKAGVVYDALDAHPEVYEPTVRVREDRSLMNVTFRLRDPARQIAFLAGARERGMEGLKGHRSVGGFRASLYNALPMDAAEALADYLRAFAAV